MTVDADAIRAARERDEAQAAQDEPEPTEQTEPEPTEQPEPAQPEPEPDEEISETQAALVKELERHERAMRKVFPDAPLVACAHCDGLGYVPPDAQEPPELLAHPRYHECEACAGIGAVLTGSKRQEFREQTCPDCQGRGFTEAPYLVPPVPAPAPPQVGAPGWMGTVNP